MAGIIRKHEIDDGMPYYMHALAMTLPQHTLANGISHPSYVAPATSTDNYAGNNTGTIPMGALMMLPASFDAASLSSAPRPSCRPGWRWPGMPPVPPCRLRSCPGSAGASRCACNAPMAAPIRVVSITRSGCWNRACAPRAMCARLLATGKWLLL